MIRHSSPTRAAPGGAGLLAALASLAGCHPTPACDAMCEPAAARFEACLDEWGLGWGETSGYEDRDDHLGWCATWVQEQRALARDDGGAGAFAALESRCGGMMETFSEGGCDAYYSAWQ
ncbi:hypothetical protein L6R50_16995 [Myxococcota bacterium]|nr:hypothetical protein [Myxococcota bacterium]